MRRGVVARRRRSEGGEALWTLALWERAASAAPAARAGALLLAAAGGAPPPSSLGARNAALLELRARLFGSAQPLDCRCAACGAVTSFTIDCAAVARAIAAPKDVDAPPHVEMAGYQVTFRLPSPADLQGAAEGADDPRAFAGALLERCVTECRGEDGSECAPAQLPSAVADEVVRRMEALDPGASIGFELACPDCGHGWTAVMDCADVLWSELRARAERLLLDVDALARAYGWSETRILRLSEARRWAYLQLVGAA